MSFIKSLLFSLYSRKTLSSVLLISFLVPAVYLSIPAKPADAFAYTIVDPGAVWHAYLIDQTANETVTAAATSISAAADTVTASQQVLFNVKKFSLDALAWTIAKMVLRGITAQTVNWINGGFQGNPAFVTNPGQFFTDVADVSVLKALGDQGTLLNKLCTPFKPQIRLALVQNYLTQGQIGQCSIQQIVGNYTAFVNDFSQGGWNGWFSMTQNMQNNPYGSYLSAQNELDLSISNQTTKYQQQLDWGKGFLSYEKCDAPSTPGQAAPPSISGSGGYPDYASEAGFAQYNCQTVTPGSLVENQLEQNLGSGVKSLEAADEINEIIGALMTEAIKSVVGGITTGLRGLSQTSVTSPRSLVTQLANTSIACEKPDPTNPKGCLDTPTGQTVQASLPASLAQAVNPNATSTALTPLIDTATIQNNIINQAGQFQGQGGSNCTIGSNGLAICAGSGTTGGTGGTGGSTGTCTLPPYSSIITGTITGCNRVNTLTCQTFSVINCGSPLGANEFYTQ